MKKDIDRVRFAVRFANGETPHRMSDREFAKLRDDIAAFLGFTGQQCELPEGAGVDPLVLCQPWPWDYTKREMHDLQSDSRQLLASAVEGTGGTLTTITNGHDGHPLRVNMVGPADARRLRIGGSVRAAFLFTLLLLMQGPAGVLVLPCPECGRLFVRRGRQKYCQAACTSRANWREYPDEKKRQHRERQYAKHGWEVGVRAKKQRDRADGAG